MLEFSKTIAGVTLTCEIECFDNGSVIVHGEDLGVAIFEFTKNALDIAIQHVSDEGYEPAAEAKGERPKRTGKQIKGRY